jgi:hypothetical protein
VRTRVYVAGPMAPQNNNILRGIQSGMHLIRAGYAPLIPHLTHYTQRYGTFPLETWLEVDFPWLSQAHALLRLEGYSRGADAEVALAHSLSIPVFHDIHDLFQRLPRTTS